MLRLAARIWLVKSHGQSEAINGCRSQFSDTYLSSRLSPWCSWMLQIKFFLMLGLAFFLGLHLWSSFMRCFIIGFLCASSPSPKLYLMWLQILDALDILSDCGYFRGSSCHQTNSSRHINWIIRSRKKMFRLAWRMMLALIRVRNCPETIGISCC